MGTRSSILQPVVVIGPLHRACLWVALLAWGCTYDYDAAFTAAAASGAGGHGGKSVAGSGGVGAAASGSAVSGSGGTSAVSSSEAASSTSSCVEPTLPCGGDNGQPCCQCTAQCGANLACVGGTCQCGGGGLPCCGGSSCATAYLACQGGTCLNCCGQCKAVDSAPVKHDFAATGGDCQLAVKNRCENVNGCNGGSPPNCCNIDNCVVQKGFWGVCP